MILSLCFSPNYELDGIALAGTLEDGILYSDSRGERWSYRGFGLLDATVYSLAISPDFAHDEMAFAGTETALYYSYNGALAWKQLPFPEEAAPILSLALSANFPQDRVLYVGTERAGLYRTADLCRSWQRLGLPAECVNALAISPGRGSLFAATESGLYRSDDEGCSWVCLLEAPNVLSLAVHEGLIVVGLADGGAWLSRDGAHWQHFFTLPARPLLGMALSPHFEEEPLAFLYGPQEGIWRTRDGGLSWESLEEGLPSLDIRSLALSPGFAQDRALVAASPAGILLSRDAGDSWSLWADEPASLVCASPSGRLYAAVCAAGAVRVAGALGGPWERLPGPWEGGREVLALALSDDAHYKVALLDPGRESLSVWEGRPGGFRQLVSHPASVAPLAALWVLDRPGWGARWYASLDGQVWEFREAGGRSSGHPLPLGDQGESKVLGLAGGQGREGPALFACTGEAIYKLTGRSWTAVHHFGPERAVALALSPSYSRDASAFALLLGGAFCRGILL